MNTKSKEWVALDIPENSAFTQLIALKRKYFFKFFVLIKTLKGLQLKVFLAVFTVSFLLVLQLMPSKNNRQEKKAIII